MFARICASVLATALMAAAATAKPLPDRQVQGAALAAACKGRSGWADAAPPVRIFGNVYYVGTCGISVLLITSGRGHILIDTGPENAASLILANIRALGFRPRDVKFIVGSHEHADHLGGLAALKAATGARVRMSASARAVLESGRTDPADPQAGTIPPMPRVAVDGFIEDSAIGFGGRGMPVLNPVPTPGHTSGGTSWTWSACEKQRCVKFAYVDSLTAVSRDGYRFADHPERVAPFRETFKHVAALPCDILITPHPGASNVFARLAGAAPLIDGEACRRLAQDAQQQLDKRLVQERAR